MTQQLGGWHVQDQTETPRENLLKSMKRTKGVRFNASKRLEKSEKTKTSVIAYASASVIILTILPAFFSVPGFVAGFLSLATVGMSVVILAATLIQNSDAGMVKSDQFHRCALEVNALRRRLMTADTNESLEDYAAQYNEIMQRYGLNHDPVDYAEYRREHLDEFPEMSAVFGSKASQQTTSEDRIADRVQQAIIAVTATLAVAASASTFGAVATSVMEAVVNSWRQILG